MQIYATMDQNLSLAEAEVYAKRVEALGYDGLNVPDAVHDGLLIAHAALRATSRLKVATSVLVCFPRSPMMVAIAAWDLQSFSEGRFELGLGTQVRGNIEGRDVLVVEDIVDTGRTLNYLIGILESHGPASIKTCTLLHKAECTEVDIDIDYVGFGIGDEWVVGYGLDYAEQNRTLPYIGTIQPDDP